MDNYQIYEEIGRVVYKGRRKKSIQYLAIKCVDKVNKEKVVNEVQLMNQLDHINVLKFFNWYETGNHYWIILEYCCGGDLLNMLMQDKRLPEQTVHLFGVDLVQGVEYIHSRGIVFCNIKPSNILVNNSGILKLSDFGLAQTIDEALNEDVKKKRRGTPYYMAPELFKSGKYSICSDLWSIGCVLYELATGRPPFVHKEFEQLVNDIIYKKHEPVQDFSADFNLLIDGCLEKDPSRRISWDDLRTHSFWKGKIPKKKYLDHQKLFLQKPKIYQNAMPKKFDQVRLSRILKTTKEKELGPSYNQGQEEEEEVRNGRQMTDIEYDFEPEDEPLSEEQSGTATPVPEDDAIDYSEEKKKKVNIAKQKIVKQPKNRMKSKKKKSSKKNLVQRSLEKHGVEGLQISGKDMNHLLFNSSDKIVKPIVMNHRIEKFVSPKYRANKLPFKALPVSSLLKMDNNDLEQFLTKIYRSLLHSGHPNDKLNTLCYFESLCKNAQSANILVNSSMTKLFLKMLASYKSVTIRYRILSIIGLLIRHATYISNDIQNYGIFYTLDALLKPGQHMKIRRRSMAVTGELVFYIASQQQDVENESTDPGGGVSSSSNGSSNGSSVTSNSKESSSNEKKKASAIPPTSSSSGSNGGSSTSESERWNIPWSNLVPTILRCMARNEDEVLQHYAVKSLDNISAHNILFTSEFASKEETLTHLVYLYMNSRNPYLKLSSLSALSRICRYKPSLSVHVMEKFGGARQYLTMGGGMINSPKQTACFLNIVNLSLWKEGQSTIVTQLLEDSKFAPLCLRWMKSNDKNVSGKVLVTAFLTCRVNRRCYYKFFESQDERYCQTLETMFNRKNESYVQNALFVLIHETTRIVTIVLDEIKRDLENLHQLTRSRQKTSYSAFNIVYYIFSTPCLSSKTIHDKSIVALSEILVHISRNYHQGALEYVQTIFNIVESISQQHELIIRNVTPMINHLLPSLIDLLVVDNGDIRFLCLKIFTDITVKYLNEEDIYDSYDKNSEHTIMINKLIVGRLLPQYSKILTDQDPIPLYGLKLLNQIVEKNPYFLTMLNQMSTTNQIIPQLIGFFQLEHRNNNVHNVRLILKVISADLLDVEYLHKNFNFIHKLNEILLYAFDNGIESFYEPCLAIVDHLLVISWKIIKECQKNPKIKKKAETVYNQNEALLKNLNIYVRMIDYTTDQSIVEITTHIMLYISQLYNGSHEFFIRNGLPRMTECLQIYLEEEELIQLVLKTIMVVTKQYNHSNIDRLFQLVKESDVEGLKENLVKVKERWEDVEKMVEIVEKITNNLWKKK